MPSPNVTEAIRPTSAGWPAVSRHSAIARRRSHWNGAAIAGMLAAAALVVSACGVPSNSPEAYNETVKANFMEGCTGDLLETGGTTTSLAQPNYCTCAYEVFVAQVPYNDDDRVRYSGYPEEAPTFTTLNADLAKQDSPDSVFNKLPDLVRSELGGCASGGGPTTIAAS
jgi:hypothetical protein